MNLKSIVLLLSILILASFLRLYHLGSNPPHLNWDEASLGYNAYSILKTGNDEYGNSLPFSIRSFDDYKPPLYVYLTIPSIALLGLNEFAVRLPSAIMGILAVLGTYLLTQEIFVKNKQRATLGLMSALFLAISPWHLQFSRGAFEANIALTIYIFAVYFFLRWINHSPVIPVKAPPVGRSLIRNLNPKILSNLSILLSAFFASLALYAYHSARLIVPIMFLVLALYYHQTLIKRKTQLIIPVFLGLLILVPIFVTLSRGSAASRFNTVSIFTNPGEFSRERERIERFAHLKKITPPPFNYFYTNKQVMATIVSRNYFEHFNFDFLFLRSDGNGRHHATGIGLLYLAQLPLLLYGTYQLVQDKHKNTKIIWFWLFIGPIASSLTASTPHAIRGLLMLPSFQLISAYGLTTLFTNYHFKKHSILYTSYSILIILNFLVYLNLYYIITPHLVSHDWQYGYKQLIHKLGELDSNYNHIIITNKYDQPHIFFAFYQKIDPTTYQSFAETAHSGFGKYTFKDIQYDQDSQKPNTLIVANPDKTPSDANIIDTITFLNGDPAFNLIDPHK